MFDAGKKSHYRIKREGHGRQEERYVFQIKAKLSPVLMDKWPTIRSIIAVEHHRTINNKCSIETSYNVS